MDTLDYYNRLLKDEIIQRREEGCDVSGFEANATSLEEAEAIYAELQELEPGMDYDEPSMLAAIQADRPRGQRRMRLTLSADDLRDKILGGWLGRCAGCQLGKPVEGWPYAHIRVFLQNRDEYPLDNYFADQSKRANGEPWPITGSLGATRELINHATRDDDQDYTIMALVLLRQHGKDFTPDHVGQKWLATLPYHQVYTAERQTYRNLVEGYGYPESATRWNPYREWIGAQIRADGWGYVTPGWPEKAAEFAFKDAAVSHIKNGIYGEMFMAAAIAAAFATSDVRECIETALTEIPRQTRFAEMAADCLRWAQDMPDWEAAWHKVDDKYGKYHWVHTLNNAALVLLALLYGEGDYEKTITLAVQGGWDTDCNGATAGSILGVMHGARQLPEKWIAPLNDTLVSGVFGVHQTRISTLADETYDFARKIAL